MNRFRYILAAVITIVLCGGVFIYVMDGGVASYVDTEARMVFDNGEVVDVEVVDTSSERMQGLSGKRGLQQGNGMLFLFERPQNLSFWMRDMNFAIDMVWVRGEEVVGVTDRVQPESFPERFHPPEPADRVLEIPAGDADRLGIEKGRTYDLRRY